MTKCRDCVLCMPDIGSGYALCKDVDSRFYNVAVSIASMGCENGQDFGLNDENKKRVFNRKERKVQIAESGQQTTAQG